MDFCIVSLEKRRSELREKHAHPDAGLPAGASSPPLSDFFLPIFKRPVQLEGQVRFHRPVLRNVMFNIVTKKSGSKVSGELKGLRPKLRAR